MRSFLFISKDNNHTTMLKYEDFDCSYFWAVLYAKQHNYTLVILDNRKEGR